MTQVIENATFVRSRFRSRDTRSRIGGGNAEKLTITVDTDVYDGLHSVICRRRISRFLNDLARPHVVGQDLAAGYTAMAADEARETAADRSLCCLRSSAICWRSLKTATMPAR
jgi:hypothetical protein